MAAPSNAFTHFLRNSTAAPVVVPAGIAAILLPFFDWAGLVLPETTPADFTSATHLLGMLLLLVLIPPYAALAAILRFRTTATVADQVRAIPGATLPADVERPRARITVPAMAAGAAYAWLFNIPQDTGRVASGDPETIGLVVGQVLIWVIVFALLADRIRVSLAFNRAGRSVPIDMFELTALKPWARIGLGDVLVIAGGLVLSTVQSIDASFRAVNYVYSMAVLVPAMCYLAIQPMWSLHRRIVTLHERELAEINARIHVAPKSLDSDAVAALEHLLQRRERVRALPAWPVDVKIVQRFLIYLVLPPIAWTGAALVEVVLEGLVR